MKRASIIKFPVDDKYIIHPTNTLKGGGGIASSPYIIEQGLTNKKLAEKLLEALEHSIDDAPIPLDWKIFQKNHLKAIGMKSMKMLHNGSLNVSVFTKDGKYHISPSINKGSRQGFQYTKERIEIPIGSSIDELANALKEAFEKSS